MYFLVKMYNTHTGYTLVKFSLKENTIFDEYFLNIFETFKNRFKFLNKTVISIYHLLL